MNRKDIFSILAEKFNADDEIYKIKALFFKKLFLYTNAYNGIQKEMTIENIVDNFLFSQWKQRGFCINCEEMRLKIGIKNTLKTIEEKIILLEYIFNLIYLIHTHLKIGNLEPIRHKSDYIIFLSNINHILEKMHYGKHFFKDEEKVILVPKNPTATAVAEISSENTAMAILMYHHASLKGNLVRKKELLRQIAQEYEPLLKKGIDGFSDYFSKARDFLNNLDIRHNNSDKPIVKNLSPEELENWYDELYQLLLFCVLIRDNKDRKDKMAEFLKTSR